MNAYREHNLRLVPRICSLFSHEGLSQLAHDVWCKLWKSCEPVIKPGKKYRCGGRSGGIGTRRCRLSRWRREAASCSVQDMHVFAVSACPGTEASS